MKELSDITKKLTVSLFDVMQSHYRSLNLIDLSKGFSDVPPAAAAYKKLSELSANPEMIRKDQYGESFFKHTLSKILSAKLGRTIDPEQEILLTFGSSEAMNVAALSVLNPGDKVIIFSPYYENYVIAASLANAEPVFVPLQFPDFQFDPDDLKQAFEAGAKALILCTPSNPSGKVFSQAELEMIEEYILKYDAYLITDEVYESIVYKPFRHIPPASLPALWERTFTCSSLSKTYSVGDWHIGYIAAPSNLIEQATKVHDYIATCFPEILLRPAAELLMLDETYYEELIDIYSKKKELFLNGLDRISLRHNNPQGAFFVMVDIGELGYENDVAFCRVMAEKNGVGAMPASHFYGNDVHNQIRLHFAKDNDILIEALHRLERIHEIKK